MKHCESHGCCLTEFNIQLRFELIGRLQTRCYVLQKGIPASSTMQTDGSSYFLEAREESASGGGLLSGELPAHTLFVSPSKGIVTEPSVELLRAFTEASIRSGVTIEWSASADALSLLKSSEAAEGYGSSCPVDAEAFLLKAHMDGLEGMDGLLLGKYR